jgi:hypothetical protein
LAGRIAKFQVLLIFPIFSKFKKNSKRKLREMKRRNIIIYL